MMATVSLVTMGMIVAGVEAVMTNSSVTDVEKKIANK